MPRWSSMEASFSETYLEFDDVSLKEPIGEPATAIPIPFKPTTISDKFLPLSVASMDGSNYSLQRSPRRAAPHQGQLSGAISLQLGQLQPAASRSAVQQLSCLAKIRSPLFAIFSARVFSSPMAIWVEVSDLQWRIRTHVAYLYVDSATGNVHFHSAARNLNPVVNDKHPQHLLLKENRVSKHIKTALFGRLWFRYGKKYCVKRLRNYST